MLKLPFDIVPCPRECGADCGAALEKCTIYPQLPPDFQQACKDSPHLLQYVHMLPVEKIGMPQYCEKVGRAQKGNKNPNLIYNVGGGVFVHILANHEDIRNNYIAVEPNLINPDDTILDEVEKRLADHVEELEGVADSAKRFEIIIDIVNRIVVVEEGKAVAKVPVAVGAGTTGGEAAPKAEAEKAGENSHGNGHKKEGGKPLFFKTGKGKLHIDRLQYNSLKYLLHRKLEGMGALDPMILDPNIEDISCAGVGNIFVEHKIFGSLKSSIGFDTNEGLDKFVIELAEGIKHPVTFHEPVINATLPNNSRINIVYGNDVSKRGSNFTIRKFSETPLSILELIQFGALNYDMAAYLSIILQEGMNVWVSGETASGKTTLMNALTTFIPPEAKIVSIEDTPEVQVPHHNWIRGCTRGSGKSGEASEVSMFDLLKAALRQRPNLIIVGEIRGVEGAIAFQAMQTGHACMSTFHAASVSKLIQRVTGSPILVPKTYVDNLNVVVICQQVRLANGSLARRLTSINEIVNYDSVGDSFSFIEVFNWNPVDDTFQFRGFQNSYLLENKIAPRRGLSEEKRRQIYKILKQRSDVLRRIHEQGKTDFYEIYAILAKAYREGLFR
ncbi:MAG TPA: type II/IV secretion system ATPase subunit [Dehalococcoidales bacterium]|nr:type II/IV secretion system ATPase subunit [Dehalococcoidales bacterium]